MTPLAQALKLVSRARQEEERLEKRSGKIPISVLLEEQADAAEKTAKAMRDAAKAAREEGR